MKKLFALFALVVMSTAVHAQKYHYDVNKDGMVNVSDVTTFVNNILGVPNGGEEEKNYVYDVNGDGITNVTDVTCLVNKILGVLNPGEDTKPCLTCPDDHHPHLIDLGLPSGTMWACCNVDTENPGKQSPSNYGGYYAWGETETKSYYEESTYQYYENGSYQSIGSDIAGTEYDVVHVKWGGSWVMASYSQQQELLDNCTSTWTTLNGVSGRLFTGTNGGSIFLPAAGYRYGSDLFHAGSGGHYWSSTQYPSSYGAYRLYFDSGRTIWSYYDRYYGRSVRPVVRNAIPVVVNDESLQVSSNELSLIAGERGAVGINTGSGYYSVQSSDENVATATVSGGTVTVTGVGTGSANITITDINTEKTAVINVKVGYMPIVLSTSSLRLAPGAVGMVDITSGRGSYTVESSAPGVATATLEGSKVTVTAANLGHTAIRVTDLSSGQIATIKVYVSFCPDDHHPHMIDLGLPSGTKWACCNVDTKNPGNQSPLNYGGYYAWGETEVKKDYSRKKYSYCKDDAFVNIGSDIAGTHYDVAHVKWGGTWVMPSHNQTLELMNNCTYRWTTVNGVSGGMLTSRKNGKSIFLPAAGYRWNGSLYDDGSKGEYWSSTEYQATHSCAYQLDFYPDNWRWVECMRNRGHCVRPVYGYFSLSATSLRLTLGAVGTRTVDITSVSGRCTVESSDPGVATATLEGLQVLVTATGLGDAVITVTDMISGQKATIKVTVVDNLSLSATSLRLAPGAAGTVDITSGCGRYTVESSAPGVATATLEGSQVTVTATGLGDAVVTVTDMVSGQKATIHVNATLCPDDHHPHLIDLGLPSGTKWACCNVDTENPGNQSPTNHGGYYAWGETEVKKDYSENTYSHGNIGSDIAGTQYDVAHVKWGGTWVMPSMDQFKELINNCTFEYTTRDGVKGCKFTSKANGCSIFLPAAGDRWYSNLNDAGSLGHYWSSTRNPSFPGYAYYLYFNSGRTEWNDDNRFSGRSVRPVSPSPLLQVSTSSLRLVPGAVGTVDITSGCGSYTVESGENDVATATLEGSQVKVTAANLGHAAIRVTDLSSGQKATIHVNVSLCPDDHHPHMVDLGLPSGTKWACCNVDTETPGKQSPTNYGGHYAWGETVVKKDYTQTDYSYDNIGPDIAGTRYDVAHMMWSGTWVMPSVDQFEELTNNCTYKWTEVDGVNGGMFTSKENGKCIFLPAAGGRWNVNLSGAGSAGNYWSSTQGSSSYAYYLYFNSGTSDWNYYDRFSGQSVRPISGK